jgi:hypothetical protein
MCWYWLRSVFVETKNIIAYIQALTRQHCILHTYAIRATNAQRKAKNVQIMFVDEQTLVLMLMNFSWHIIYQTNRVHQFLDKGNGLVAERHLPKGTIVFTEVCVCVCVCAR